MITQQGAFCLGGRKKICEKKYGNARLTQACLAIVSWSVFLRIRFELGLFGGQPAGFSDFLQVDSQGRKFSNLRAAGSLVFHAEKVRAEHVACGPFVHGEEVPANPVPVVGVMMIVDANQNVHLWLSPEAGPVWPGQPCSGMKIGQSQLAVRAIKDDSRLIVTVRCVVGREFEAGPMGGGHAVFGTVLGPISARVRAIAVLAVAARLLRRVLTTQGSRTET